MHREGHYGAALLAIGVVATGAAFVLGNAVATAVGV